MTSEPHRFFSARNHGFVRVAVATPLVAVADPERNGDATIDLLERATAENADLVLFPELGFSGYAIEDLHLQDALLSSVDRALARVTERTRDLQCVALVGAPLRRNGRVYNCAVAIHRGAVLGVVPKTFLPNYREYYEKRWFASGAGLRSNHPSIGGACSVRR